MQQPMSLDHHESQKIYHHIIQQAYNLNQLPETYNKHFPLLSKTIIENDSNLLMALLNEKENFYPSLNETDCFGLTPIHWAVVISLKTLHAILAKDPQLLVVPKIKEDFLWGLLALLQDYCTASERDDHAFIHSTLSILCAEQINGNMRFLSYIKAKSHFIRADTHINSNNFDLARHDIMMAKNLLGSIKQPLIRDEDLLNQDILQLELRLSASVSIESKEDTVLLIDGYHEANQAAQSLFQLLDLLKSDQYEKIPNTIQEIQIYLSTLELDASNELAIPPTVPHDPEEKPNIDESLNTMLELIAQMQEANNHDGALTLLVDLETNKDSYGMNPAQKNFLQDYIWMNREKSSIDQLIQEKKYNTAMNTLLSSKILLEDSTLEPSNRGAMRAFYFVREEQLSLCIKVSQWGYETQDVKGDGNCLFHAVAIGLGYHQEACPQLNIAQFIRELAINHIKHNLDVYEPFLSALVNEGQTFKEFLTSLEQDGIYAEEYLLTALANEFKKTIVVFHNNEIPNRIFKPQNAHAENILLIGMQVARQHYELVVKTQTQCAEDIQQQRNLLQIEIETAPELIPAKSILETAKEIQKQASAALSLVEDPVPELEIDTAKKSDVFINKEIPAALNTDALLPQSIFSDSHKRVRDTAPVDIDSSDNKRLKATP